ncbi:MAG: ribonuclease H-like domain-containing protein [Candidatus Aenigmatarchaeota archaeon]
MKVFLDIECTNTRADIGQIVAIGIIKDDKKEVKFVDQIEDERDVLNWLKKELEGCDLVVTWYGSEFDIPFLVTRALINNINLSELMKIPSLDLCEFCKRNFLFSKNSLSEISKSLKIPKDEEIGGKDVLDLYLKAIRGDKGAKEKIIKHCLDDLEVLEKIFKKFEPYLNLTTKNP